MEQSTTQDIYMLRIVDSEKRKTGQSFPAMHGLQLILGPFQFGAGNSSICSFIQLRYHQVIYNSRRCTAEPIMFEFKN